MSDLSEVGVVGDGTYLTVGEAVAELAGLVSEDTVRRMADRGELRTVRLPTRGDRRIMAEDVHLLRDRLKGQIPAEPADPQA